MIHARGLLDGVRRKQVANTLFHGVVATLLLSTAPAFAARTSGEQVSHRSAQRTSSHRTASNERHAASHRRGRGFARSVAYKTDEDENKVASSGQAGVPDGETLDHGTASWYDLRGNGPRTSGGQRFDENAMTAAHIWLPLGTRVRVTIVGTNQSVVVTINDRPGATSRVIDLSKGAARELGIIDRGTAKVILTRG